MLIKWRNVNMSKVVEQIENTLMGLKEHGVLENEIIKRYEKKILSLKNAELSYVFAKNVKGFDVKAHGQVIIECKEPEWNYKFAKDVKGADVKAHEKVIIESKDPEWNYGFAKHVKGADVIAHGQVIIESKNSTYNDRFKENFKDEYKIIERNNFIDGAYNFIDDVLDEVIKKNNEENKSMQKRS